MERVWKILIIIISLLLASVLILCVFGFNLEKHNLEIVAIFLGLVLSLINGSILLYNYLTDKPSLTLKLIKNSPFQCWINLPDSEYKENKTKRFGFFVYFSVANKGRRTTTVSSWKLEILTEKGEWQELPPRNIPEVSFYLPDKSQKNIPVFGQRGPIFKGKLTILPGENASGVAFYLFEYWGHKSYSPKIINNKMKGRIKVKDIFDNEEKIKVQFKYKKMKDVEKLIPNLEQLVSKNNEK